MQHDQILAIVNTEDRRLTKHFLLRLSCQLIDGLVLVHQRQAKILIRDILTIDRHVRNILNPKPKRNRRQRVPKNPPRLTTPPKEKNTIIEISPVQPDERNDFFGEKRNPISGIPNIETVPPFEAENPQNVPPEHEHTETIIQQNVSTAFSINHSFNGPMDVEVTTVAELDPLENITHLNRQRAVKRKRQPTAEEKLLNSAQMVNNMISNVHVRCETQDDDSLQVGNMKNKSADYKFSQPSMHIGNILIENFQKNAFKRSLSSEESNLNIPEEVRADTEQSARRTRSPEIQRSHLNIPTNLSPLRQFQPVKISSNGNQTSVELSILNSVLNINGTTIGERETVATPTDYMSEEWGYKPLMAKILANERDPNKVPLTVRLLITKYYTPACNISERIVASKVFFNLIHLKARGWIQMNKNESNEVTSIELTQSMRSKLDETV